MKATTCSFVLILFALAQKTIVGFIFGKSFHFLLKTYHPSSSSSSSNNDNGSNGDPSSSSTASPSSSPSPLSKFVYILNEKERSFQSSSEYLQYLQTIATLPKGFQVGAIRFPFQPIEIQNKQLPMNVSCILLDAPTTAFAAAFTSNQFPGGPILVGKQRLQCSESIQAIIINNKISNVCPNGVEDFGYSDSDRVCEKVAEVFELSSKQAVLPSSTGIIGWRLPIQAIIEKIVDLKGVLQNESILPIALGIMTTDRYPKIRSYHSKKQPNKSWSIVGIAKGAGMIEPNLATMLSYLLTDLHLSKQQLQSSLNKVLSSTFNSISVDGDQSTSDTVVLLSSSASHPSPVDDDPLLIEEFENALYSICYQLAEDIVRNGEGTQHVIRVRVKGIANRKIAKFIGKSIINSSLVKCAIAGNDPNVGRIVSSIGSILGNIILPLAQSSSSTSPASSFLDEGNHLGEGVVEGGGAAGKDFQFQKENLRISLGEIVIFEKGGFRLNPEKEELLYQYLLSCQLYDSKVHEHDRNYPPHERSVDLLIDFLPSTVDNSGKEDSSSSSVVYEVIGSDLTKEYVEINADYRS